MPAVRNLSETYEVNGVLPRIDVFSESEISAFRAQFDELEAREGRDVCQVGLQSRHFDEEFIWRLAADARLLDVMEQAMGEDILLLATHFFCKYPAGDEEHFVAWHQDVTYWGLEPPLAHTAWIAIDDSDAENGCMRVIPGSHKSGIVTHGTSEREGNLLSINQEIPDELVDTGRAIDLELSAGQTSVHHGQLFHASMPNTSNRRRCGLTVRFIPPEARQVASNSIGQDWRPILLRGVNRYTHHPHFPAPFPVP